MRKTVSSFMFLFALAAALNASSIGVAVNRTCEAGSCPAVGLPFHSADTLPVDFTVTLSDGDRYLIDGPFSSSNTGNGAGFRANHLFQVTYEGNATGGPSAADTITVEAYFAFQTSLGSTNEARDVIGAFGPTIAVSSSASSCVNVVLGCVGPFKPPKSFHDITGFFSLKSTSGALIWDPVYTNNFGAGSPVGSYIVWGQTKELTPRVPEPGTYLLFRIGCIALAAIRRYRSPADKSGV